MKKLIAILAVMFSTDAAAFSGTGNDRIDEAREYMRRVTGGADINYELVNYWLGVVSGMSQVYSHEGYKYRVCYPKGSNVGQIAEIAARYLIDHPEERAKQLWFLIWQSHSDAFGFADKNCWLNTEE